jgi:hypothetical protein
MPNLRSARGDQFNAILALKRSIESIIARDIKKMPMK